MRIGILGGTFNPPHLGHLIVAREALKEAGLDRVLFIPCGNPPHKEINEIADVRHRLEMVKLSVDGYTDFEVSDIESIDEGKSYTAKTLEKLKDIYPEDRLCFIVGADSLCQMKEWFCPEKIFEQAEIVVAGRGGIEDCELEKAISEYKKKYNADITRITMETVVMSSSDIRRRIRHGQSIKDMVCDKVIDYIEKTGIYKGNHE